MPLSVGLGFARARARGRGGRKWVGTSALRQRGATGVHPAEFGGLGGLRRRLVSRSAFDVRGGAVCGLHGTVRERARKGPVCQ